MRQVFRVMLRWTLSPLGAVLYTGMLAALLLFAGADPGGLMFWLPVALFLGVCAFYDVSAYIVQRREGLTSSQVADAVLERLWPAREEGVRR